MSAATTDRLVTRRRNGNKVGSLQRRVKELRKGVCSARTCAPMCDAKNGYQRRHLADMGLLSRARHDLTNYREDAPHVVTALRAECSFLHRLWFALGFVLFGFSRERMRRKEARGW